LINKFNRLLNVLLRRGNLILKVGFILTENNYSI